MSKEKVNNEVENIEIEEVTKVVDVNAEPEKEEVVVPEKESFKDKVKRNAPKVAKVLGIGALTVASFVLGTKVGKKSSNSDDGENYIDADYEILDDESSYETNETANDTNE